MGPDPAVFGPFTPSALPAIQQRPTNELIAEALRRHIRLGLYTPGEQLPTERELAEHFAVGRTTIRSAIRLLTAEGLVETRRGRSGGTAVREDDGRTKLQILRHASVAAYVREIEDIYELRLAVEPVVAAGAARRATPQQRGTLVAEASRVATTVAEFRAYDSRFHLALAESGGNRFALETIQRLRTALFLWLDGLWAEVNKSESRQTEDEHRAIALAVVAADEENAQRLMEQHLVRGRDGFRDALEKLAKGTRPGRA